MEISVVIPIFNGEKNIPIVYQEIKNVLESLGEKYEIIYVDDGSTDNTFTILKNLKENDETLKIIKFKKNFGQHSALAAGFKHSSGEIIITMDNDLECSPSEIPNLLKKISEGYDLVSSFRVKRAAPLFSRKIPSLLMNFIVSKLTKVKLQDYGCPLKVWRKNLILKIVEDGDIISFLPKLKNFKIAELKIKTEKLKESSSYNFLKLLKLFFQVLSTFFWPKKKKTFYEIEEIIG